MIPKSKCTACEHTLWDDEPPKQPEKGDIAVCIFCGCINEFDENLQLISPKSITKEAKELSIFVKEEIKKMNGRLAKRLMEKLYGEIDRRKKEDL